MTSLYRLGSSKGSWSLQPSEIYTVPQIESALLSMGFTLIQEDSGLCLYGNNHYPGDELVLDSSRGSIDWPDLQAQLEWQGIDVGEVHRHLTESN